MPQEPLATCSSSRAADACPIPLYSDNLLALPNCIRRPLTFSPVCSTGRKRRCGWFDAVVVRYAHALNGFTSLNLTKLDVLDELETVKIARNYKLRGEVLPLGAFPATLEDLAAVEVEYEEMPGWRQSTRGITKFASLPPAARAYIKRLEELVDVPIAWIGTGPGRHEMITRGFKLDSTA